MLARVDRVEPEDVEDLRQDHRAGDDHGRPLRLERRHLAPLGQRQRREPLQLRPRARRGEPVPVDALAVVALEPEVERGERRDRAGDADRRSRGRADLVGDALHEQRADGARATSELVRRRRVRGEEPLGVADGAELEADMEVVEDQLGRAAADVDHERPRPQLASGGDAAPRQQRLVVAREHARREAVAPLDLAEERLAVLGLAHGARRDRERPLGAERLEVRR